MNNTTTHDYLANEEEADYWLLVFEQLPDGLHFHQGLGPRAFIIDNIKSYARTYQSVYILGKHEGIIIN